MVSQAGQTARSWVSPSSGTRYTTAAPQLRQCLMGVRKVIGAMLKRKRERAPKGPSASTGQARDAAYAFLAAAAAGLPCFSISARAVSSSFLPSKPRLFMSSAHSTSTSRALRLNSWASAAGIV